jgi:hypothetical protein
MGEQRESRLELAPLQVHSFVYICHNVFVTPSRAGSHTAKIGHTHHNHNCFKVNTIYLLRLVLTLSTRFCQTMLHVLHAQAQLGKECLDGFCSTLTNPKSCKLQ